MSREEGLTELYALVEVSTTDAVEKANLLSLCHDIISQNRQSSELLTSIPILRSPSPGPLACLSLLLRSYNGPWPVLELICRHTKLWKALPEELKQFKSSELVETVLRQIKATYRGLPDLLHRDSDKPAILEPQSSRYLTHKALSRFIERFSLPIAANNTHTKPVIAIALPNGPLLGIVCLAICAKYTAAPINATAGAEQFRADVLQANASVILAAEADVERLELRDSWVRDAGIEVLIVNQQADMTFDTSSLSGITNYTTAPAPVNGPDDTALILSTSGTSGTKKIVPFTLHTMISGVAFVVESWGLTDKDRCLNMMPLNHVGGLVRNLFAPVLSGGSTVCCPAFDPNLFWDVVEDQSPTWYYASPSMHSAILSEASFRPEAMAKNQMRLVCNAAGGLLPSLAIQLRDTFNCTVLPSYGMTECMPISTPPLDYRLDRPGTSGVSTGPEMSVLSGSGEVLPPREVGYVCVRGAAVFLGYLTASGLDRSAFNKNGWFDTGDMGYLDEDGYVYITGRSKEVINRGGEIISPFEVEEAIMVASKNPESPIFGRVSEALIFSAPHTVLQEVVGAVLVTPPGKPRVDLRQLQKALGHSLHSVKWPVVIVYMDSVPKRNNKVLRIKLGERLSFAEVTDHALQSERHFEATCPPPDTPLSQKIEKHSCAVDSKIVTDAIEGLLPQSLDVHVATNPHDGLLTAYVAPRDIGTEDPRVYGNLLAAHLPASLDGYLVPQHIHYIGETFPRSGSGAVDIDRLRTIVSSNQKEDITLTSYEKKIRAIFAELLSCEAADITSDSDFFELGGDSMKAGRLLSILRKELNVRLPIDMLFQNGSVSSLGEIVEKSRPSSKDGPEVTITPAVLPGCSKTYSSTNFFLLCLQLVPIAILYPMKRALEYTILLYTLSMMLGHWGPDDIPGRLLCLVVAIAIARCIMRIVGPLVAICIKWIVIGRHKEGMYPMWGPYHTRWWFVQKALMVGGKGFFGDFNWSRVLYFRLLGAKIGKGVSLDKKALLGEYDLIEIGDNVRLDPCICRPFAAERNTSMYLGRIKIGNNCSVGLKSIVAAGTVLPDNTHIGPNSSSFEAEDASEVNRDLSPGLTPSASPILSILIGIPIKVSIVFISLLPWMAGLVGLVDKAPGESDDMIRSVVLWFASPMRVGFHFLARVLNHTVGPVFFLVSVIVLKYIMDSMFGRMQPGSVLKRSQLDRFRKQLVNDLLPSGDLSSITGLFGSHYEATSMVVRALGGKVGRNVYWPGSGPTIQDFDMVDIGNDVVFGSRSHLITSDGIGTGRIKINDGVMVADRVVIAPGVNVGTNTVLGSGALLKRDSFYPDNTVWVGSKQGEAICLTRRSNATSEKSDLEKSAMESITSSKESLESEDTSTSSPFGRAFYEGKANYRVLGMFSIFCYCLIIQIAVSIYWNVPTISSMQFMGIAIERYPHLLGKVWYRPFMLYSIILAVNIGLLGAQALIAVSTVIAAKWILMGRRMPGSYDWDKSSYCQRWQIFLTVERLRRQCFGGHGVIGMLTGTHYTVMYFRAMGANIGKDCALFAGGRPSLLFTEPDLLTIGDRVAIDDASLVAHINSRGNFSLNPLFVGDQSVLRSGSRLLSGATMKADSCLLEHTLIMAGDIVDQGTTYQGWPAEIYDGERVHLTTI